MEMPKNGQDNMHDHDCSMHHGWCMKHEGHWVVRLIVCLVVFAIVFAAGYGAGRLKSKLSYEVLSYPMMGVSGYCRAETVNVSNKLPGWGMMGYYGSGSQRSWGWNMMRNWWGFRSDDEDLDKIFGSVVKVDGNKINVADNGGKQQVIISSSNTEIISAGEEVALLSLKSGRSISAFGSMNKDNQLEAKTICVSSL